MLFLWLLPTLLPALVHSQSALEFLRNFGYVEGGNPSSDELLQGIQRYQSFVGLPVSGQWDKATRATLLTPRCGMIDGNDTALDGGRRWTRNARITFRFLNYTADLPREIVRRTFIDSFNQWSQVSSIQFAEETSSSKMADISISFRPDGTGEFRSLITGHVNPGTGQLILNDAHLWSVTSVLGVELRAGALHMVGHLLGLGHQPRTATDSAMFPQIGDGRLTAGDISRIQALYGVNPCSPNNPCRNGGRCTKNPASRKGYKCHCVSGWKGKKCTTSSSIGTTVCRQLSIQNGRAVPSGRVRAWDRVSVRCNVGYHLTGAGELRCTDRGDYLPHPRTIRCVQDVTCAAVSLLNGTVHPSGPTTPRTILSLSCDEGFELSGGSSRLTCGQNGQLSGALPSCQQSVEPVNNNVDCPKKFEMLVSRSLTDRLIFAFGGDRYWIYKRSDSSGGIEPFTSSSTLIDLTFPSELTNAPLDAAFALTEQSTRYFCFVSWPSVYFVELKNLRTVARTEDFPSYFGVQDRVTAAAKWDKNTVLFFTESSSYHRYTPSTRATSTAQPLSNEFPGLPAGARVVAAGKTFTSWTKTALLLLDTQEVYEVAKSDGHVIQRSSFSAIFHTGLPGCEDSG